MATYYPLGDRIPGVDHLAQHNYRARATGEKRPPRAGEWYLSGSPVTAYRMPNDASPTFVMNIARLVKVERVEYYREVTP